MFAQGSAFYWNPGRPWFIVTTDTAFGGSQTLVEDDTCKDSLGMLEILAFSKVVFIPRSAVLKALDRNPRAWKDCARWKYLQEVLRQSRSQKGNLESDSP